MIVFRTQTSRRPRLTGSQTRYSQKKRGPNFLNVFSEERTADALSGAAGHCKKEAIPLSKKNCCAVHSKVRNRQKIAENYYPHPFSAPERPSSGRKKTGTEQKNCSVPVFRNLPPRMRLPESGLHYQRVRHVSAPAIRPAASTCSIRFFHRLYSPKTDTPSR